MRGEERAVQYGEFKGVEGGDVINAFRSMRAEWQRVCAVPEYEVMVRGWLDADGVEAPAAPYGAGLGELLRALKERESSDEWMRALLRRATTVPGAEQGLAVQMLIEAMTPAALRSVRRLRAAWGLPVDEVATVVLGALYEAIVRYPMRREPRRIASRLSLETYHHAVRELRAEAPSMPPAADLAEQLVGDERGQVVDPVAYAELALLAEEAGEVVPDFEPDAVGGAQAELAELLVWALREQVLTPVRARTLTDHYRPGAPRDAEAARREGVRPATWRQWRSRAVRDLRKAAPRWLAQAA